MDITSDWQSNKTFVGTNSIMFENEIATDVTFSFPNSKEKVKAHKYILMSRSQVFFRMFTATGFQGTQQQINIEDMEPNKFKDFIRFLYYGSDLKVDPTNAIDMLYNAEKYGVSALKVVCLKTLEQDLCENTVALYLEVAIMYNADHLKKMCLAFLSQPGRNRLTALWHHHVSANTLNVILDEKAMCSRALEVFTTCNTWAHEECVNRGLEPNSGNKRKVLGNMLVKIPFQNMSVKVFADHVSPVEILTHEEQVRIFRCLASGKPPSYVSKENISRVTVKIPTKVNIPNIRNNGFRIEMKCSKKFKLVGISFPATGKFNININKKSEEFPVSKAGIQMTKDYGMDHELILHSKGLPETKWSASQEHGAVPFSNTCRYGQVRFTRKAYISDAVPFEAIVVDISTEV